MTKKQIAQTMKDDITKYYLAGNSIHQCCLKFKVWNQVIADILKESDNPTVQSRLKRTAPRGYIEFEEDTTREFASLVFNDDSINFEEEIKTRVFE